MEVVVIGVPILLIFCIFLFTISKQEKTRRLIRYKQEQVYFLRNHSWDNWAAEINEEIHKLEHKWCM